MEDTTLPANWRAARDSDGKEYYFNELTGETSWVVPDADPPKAPQALTTSASMEAGTVNDSSEFAPSNAPQTMMSVQSFGSDPAGGGKGRSSSYDELSGLVGERVLPRLILVMVCSFVVMLQSSIEAGRTASDGGTQSYGIAVGSISLAFALGLLFFAKLRPEKFSNLVVPKIPGSLSILQLFAIFLVAWWVPAVIVLTFFNPFTQTSNAYFACWAATIASLLILGDSFVRVGDKFRAFATSRVHQDSNAKSLIGLALASVVVFCSSFEYAGEGMGQGVFGLVVGIASAVLSLLVYFLADKQKIGLAVKKAFALLLVLLWIIAAIVLTFDKPFNKTSNGFFSTWAALFCAMSYIYQIFGGGEFGLVKGVARSLSFHEMEDVRGSRLESVSVPVASVPGVAVRSNVA